ncbi:MAG: hypothetical protein WBC74_00210 [Candidatus Omnitrophota bacterium]
MIDRKLEGNIKKTKEFVEIWGNFRKIFKNNDEKNFLATRTLVNSRYDDLMDSIGEKPIKRFIKNEPLYNILSLENLSIMSDERLKKLDKDWNESSGYLSSLLERLERKKRRIEGFNRFFFLLKNVIRRKR